MRTQLLPSLQLLLYAHPLGQHGQHGQAHEESDHKRHPLPRPITAWAISPALPSTRRTDGPTYCMGIWSMIATSDCSVQGLCELVNKEAGWTTGEGDEGDAFGQEAFRDLTDGNFRYVVARRR